MNKRTMIAALLAGACGLAQAGSSSTTMEMSFVIRAACTVQAHAGAAPHVACSPGTAYQVVRHPAAPGTGTAAPEALAQDGAAWQVVF